MSSNIEIKIGPDGIPLCPSCERPLPDPPPRAPQMRLDAEDWRVRDDSELTTVTCENSSCGESYQLKRTLWPKR